MLLVRHELEQIVSLIVGFGIVSNVVAGSLISATTAAVNVAFLIAHGLHANAAAKVTAAKTSPIIQLAPAVPVAPKPGK